MDETDPRLVGAVSGSGVDHEESSPATDQPSGADHRVVRPTASAEPALIEPAVTESAVTEPALPEPASPEPARSDADDPLDDGWMPV